MRYFVVILALLAVSNLIVAKEPSSSRPKRTPEEIARKQTCMLVREFALTDSLQIDSIFRMNLKYTLLRAKNETREQELDCLQHLTEELRGLLSPEQFERFINHQLSNSPRCQHTSYVANLTDSTQSKQEEQ